MADFERNADGQPSVDPTIMQNLVRCRTASLGASRMLATERPGHPLALFIPGVMTEVTTTWLRVIPLTSLFNIIAFELPGHGISQEVADVSTEAFALEYAAFIDRYVAPAQRVCVIGESFGGLIGAAMARLHPDRIAHLEAAAAASVLEQVEFLDAHAAVRRHWDIVLTTTPDGTNEPWRSHARSPAERLAQWLFHRHS